jgi:hypothetical protein
MKSENINNLKEFVRTVIEYGFWTDVNFLAMGILE